MSIMKAGNNPNFNHLAPYHNLNDIELKFKDNENSLSYEDELGRHI